MQRLLAGLMLWTGCFSPSIAPGAACDTECPGGLVCIDHVCREPGFVAALDAGPRDAFVPIDVMVDGAPGDIDADGIDDGTDNCPSKANVDQHDEDADAVGDVCDACPHLSGSTDSDGDGVGDACDPQPAVAKQRIQFFDPFTTDRIEWTQKNNVTRVGETMRLDAAPSAGALLVLGHGESRLMMAGTIVGLAASASSHKVMLGFGRNPAGTIYHFGEFYDTGGPGKIAVTRVNQGMYATLASGSYNGVLPTGAWSMRADLSVATQRITLDTSLGGTMRTLLGTMATTPALTTSDTIAIGITGADVRLDYFIAIETLP